MSKLTDAELLALPGVRRLLGCEFGTRIGVVGAAETACQKRATGRVVLYDGGRPLPTFQFCDEHMRLIDTQSTPRSAP